MFGVANQLLATIALAVGTTIIIRNNRNKLYGLITFIPMLFMLATTVAAGLENIFNNYLPQQTFNGNLNALLSAGMLFLAVVIIADSSLNWFQYIRKHGLITRAADRDLKTKEKDPYVEVEA